MLKPNETTNYYFVDESGDPTFYNRNGSLIVGNEGCSKILIMGFIETLEPTLIRKGLAKLREELLSDAYLDNIYSMQKTRRSFHAKDDCPEVRQAVFKLINQFDFKAQFVVARKIEQVFRRRFDAKETKFYDHLITMLFENVLHRHFKNHIYFSKRGSRDKQIPLETAIKTAIERFESKWTAQISSKIINNVYAQQPTDEPCLQVIDYMNWAVYRAYTKAEMRYYKFVEQKVSLLLDLYDSVNYPNIYYSKKYPFDVNKISPI